MVRLIVLRILILIQSSEFFAATAWRKALMFFHFCIGCFILYTLYAQITIQKSKFMQNLVKQPQKMQI